MGGRGHRRTQNARKKESARRARSPPTRPRRRSTLQDVVAHWHAGGRTADQHQCITHHWGAHTGAPDEPPCRDAESERARPQSAAPPVHHRSCQHARTQVADEPRTYRQGRRCAAGTGTTSCKRHPAAPAGKIRVLLVRSRISSIYSTAAQLLSIPPRSRALYLTLHVLQVIRVWVHRLLVCA